MALLAGRTAVITGGAQGLGLAIAERFLAEGARVVLGDLNLEATQAAAEGLGSAALARGVRCDVTSAADVDALIAVALDAFGGLDIMVNNAGITRDATMRKMTEQDFGEVIDVHLKGTWNGTRAAAAVMREQGRGAIINMSSQAGRRGEPLVSHYCASKAAIISYTQSAALAMAPHHIRVNAIAPGVIDTPMWGGVDALFAKYEHLAIGEKKIQVGKAVPLGYMGAPSDIAGAVVFLASDEASYITAQTLNVDGGNWMS